MGDGEAGGKGEGRLVVGRGRVGWWWEGGGGMGRG